MSPCKLSEFCLQSNGVLWPVGNLWAYGANSRILPDEMHRRTSDIVQTCTEQRFSDCTMGAGNFNWAHRSGNKYLGITLYKIGELECKLGRAKRNTCQAGFYKIKS